MKIINAYIGQKQWTRIGQDEAALRRFFEFGRKLGVTGFTGEPAPAQWDMVERLVQEFGVTFSIHNHAKGFEADYFGGPYPYFDPSKTAALLNEQKRDARVGLCLDTGHVARSGLDVTAVTKACAGRIISAHLKDVARVKLNDVRYGTGMVDVAAVLAELRRQKIAGHIALEYESFDSPTFAEDIRSLVDFIRDHHVAESNPKKPAAVVVTAHPDDLECGVSGMLLRLKDQFAIHLFVASKGERGLRPAELEKDQPTPPSALTARIREGEARAAAELLGAGITFLAKIDGEIYPDAEGCTLLAEHLTRLKPAAVFTMWGQDVPDHASAGHMTLRALWDTKLMWSTDLFFMSAGDDQTRLYPPDLLVPMIAAEHGQKLAVMRCHACQNSGDHLANFVIRKDTRQGAMLGAPFAEALKPWHSVAEMEKKNRPVYRRLVELGMKPTPER